jgi:hypothetical protein
MKIKLVYTMMLLIFLAPIVVLAVEEQVVIDIQGMTCNL